MRIPDDVKKMQDDYIKDCIKKGNKDIVGICCQITQSSGYPVGKDRVTELYRKYILKKGPKASSRKAKKQMFYAEPISGGLELTIRRIVKEELVHLLRGS